MYYSKSLLAENINAIKLNKINPIEFIDSACKIIDKNEPKIQALLPEQNRKQRLIRQTENLIKKFPNVQKRPSLFGIPVGIKDIINANDFETKAGSKFSSNIFKGKESSVVTKLKNAGALILGKTVTTEFAYYEPGPTRNPHNLKHTPGGSSSGSAAAVAAGFTPLAIGTQTIGSVIRPAAFCGIIGFKPSYNRIDKDGLIDFSTSADHIGIFTQDIEGVQITASILCTNWENEPKITNSKPVIGVIEGKYLQQANPEIIKLFEAKVKQLEKSGFKIVRIKLFENIETINKKHLKMISAEFSTVHENWYEKNPDLYRSATKKLILDGKKVTIGELFNSRLGREQFRNYIETKKIEHKIDLWLSPATATPAPEGIKTGSPIMNLPWTYAGLPVITIPAGKTIKNLPFGLQFSGSFMKDEIMLEYVKKISIFK